jgi:hypothetical protein
MHRRKGNRATVRLLTRKQDRFRGAANMIGRDAACRVSLGGGDAAGSTP